MIRVKICGLTSLEDAIVAAESGADLLGFVLYAGSPRHVPGPKVREIVHTLRTLRPDARPRTVGVFVDEEPSRVREVLEECGLDYAQLHGHESPSCLRALHPRAYKALPVQNEAQLLQDVTSYIMDYEADGAIPVVLLDAYHPRSRGGTGQTFDWDIARKVSQECHVLLAGGLKCDNVALAIRKARPWGVDVSSGVEVEPGKKDAVKIRCFIEAAKEVDNESDS